jgi:glycosyltransferase involved in cell wall biosynthesis
MKVGIEATTMLVREKTGIECYTTELVSALVNLLPNHPDLELVLYFHAGDKNSDRDLVEFYQNSFVNVKKRFYYPQRWYRPVLLLTTMLDQLDLFHCPSPIIPLAKTCSTVMTFHDISLDLHDSTTKRDVLGALSRSDFNIAVSEDTRNALIRYGIDPEKIVVIYEGVPRNFFPNPEGAKLVTEKYKLQKYILFVGTFHPRKNHIGLLDAYQMLRNEFGITQSLVLAGKKASAYDPVLEKIHELGLENYVKILDYVPLEEMSGLYSGADVHVLPSLHEGFGLTALESMACGTPVVVSKAGSLPEVVKDAGEYFNPTDIHDMARVINRVLTDQDLQQKLREAGFNRAKEFSWLNTASRTIDIYRYFYRINK